MGVAEREPRELAQTAVSLAADELRLLEALRHGDEAAFAALIDRYHAPLLRLALAYAPSRAAAEQIVQETWLDMLQGLALSEGHVALRTWLFGLLVERLKRQRAGGEGELFAPGDMEGPPAVAAERFLPPDHAQWPGHWAARPPNWGDAPEGRLQARETRGRIEGALAALPPSQRAIIGLRDVDGWTVQEVVSLLGISEAQQRALLHQARSRVRREIEACLYES